MLISATARRYLLIRFAKGRYLYLSRSSLLKARFLALEGRTIEITVDISISLGINEKTNRAGYHYSLRETKKTDEYALESINANIAPTSELLRHHSH